MLCRPQHPPDPSGAYNHMQLKNDGLYLDMMKAEEVAERDSLPLELQAIMGLVVSRVYPVYCSG